MTGKGMDRFVPRDDGDVVGRVGYRVDVKRVWRLWCVIASEARQSMDRFVPRDDGEGMDRFVPRDDRTWWIASCLAMTGIWWIAFAG